jgi:hypothetical protein
MKIDGAWIQVIGTVIICLSVAVEGRLGWYVLGLGAGVQLLGLLRILEDKQKKKLVRLEKEERRLREQIRKAPVD